MGIMDRNQDFYFMEMNTRLQVEHPVSEMITGVDLVEWQLRIARGEEIPIAQKDIPLIGHSVEGRVYAEDPENGFLPGAGKLVYLSQPEASEDVRVETGVRQGDDVSQYYDPMIAKLVVWGNTRQEALDRLSQRLTQYHVVGLPTNIQFLKRVAQSDEFQNAELDTGFIERHEHKLIPKTAAPSLESVVSAAMVKAYKEPVASIDPFDLLTNWRVNQPVKEVVDLNALGETYSSTLTTVGDNKYKIEVNGQTFDGRITKSDKGFVVEVNGVKSPVSTFTTGEEFYLFTDNGPILFEIPMPKYMA